MIEPYIDIKLKQQREELNDEAFALFFECWIINFLDLLHTRTGELDYFLEINYCFDINPPDNFRQIVKRYISIRKIYKNDQIRDVYPIYMIPFEKVVPNQIELSALNVIKEKLVFRLHSTEFIEWLHKHIPEFYLANEGYAFSILNAYKNSRRIFTGLSCKIFYFIYAGSITNYLCTYSRNHANKHFHINEIMSMRNGILDPVMCFGGGPGDHFGFEPDLLYGLKNKINTSDF